MTLDKSINNGKEKRKPYRGAKACDRSCRNGGSCPYCRETRQFSNKKRMRQTEYECEECFDTGCVCGGMGHSCDGCCHCPAANNPGEY